MKHLVLGGGLVGRILAARLPDVVILEAKDESFNKRPNFAFGTNYLWKDIPEFGTQKVRITTRIDDELPTPEAVQRYKNKIGKGSEKVNEWGLQFEPSSEGYLVKTVPYADVRYGMKISSVDFKKRTVIASDKAFEYDVLHSTLPLPDLLRFMGLSHRFPIDTLFKFKPVFVRVVPIPPEAKLHKRDEIYVNYISNPLIEPYRFCDRFGENERHYESLTPIGFPHKRIYPGKIWGDPCISDILTELRRQDIHCWGRYGAWKPNELLHETYEEACKWTL